MRHGGQILVDQLVKLGVRRVFSVPGESFLAALDGLFDAGIDNIVGRQEGGVAMMAEAYGKMTGQPGVAFVTRGPGATNASAGLHIAQQDSTPMVLFVGQIDNRFTDRETFQEVNYRDVFGGLVKWVAQVEHTERLPEYIARAFRVAQSGRPGPVVLALPENILSAPAEVPDFTGVIVPQATAAHQNATPIVTAMGQAERPLIIVGGPHWDHTTAKNATVLAERLEAPVVTSFRRQDYVDNRHSHFAGDLNVGLNPRLGARVREADCLLLIGTRFGDIATQGYTLVDPENPKKTILHIHSDAAEIGRVFGATHGWVETAPRAIAALIDAIPQTPDRRDWIASARADYDAWITPQTTPGDVKLEQVVKHLSDTLPHDAIVTNGAGNYAAWLHRYFVYKTFGTQLAPTSGSMGYGFPAAVSASLENPDKTIVCLAGDGCFQMTLNEASTAVQHGAKPIVIVVNNGRYGTIRMHQEKHYPGRVSGTMLVNPDFAALAQAYGGHGETVTTTAEFPAAFERATKSGTLAVINLIVDEDALSPGLTLSGLAGS